MSVLQRVTGWLRGKSANGAQPAYGGYNPRGYYGSNEAEDAYGSMNADRGFGMPEAAAPAAEQPAPDERFSASGDPYNGRVPYRSRRDMQQEQEEYARRQAQPDQRHRRTDAQQTPYPQQQQPFPQQGYPQQSGNVVDFPQQQAAPAHVEYVILLRSRNECTKVIEYIKTNASVFLNMEYIANESERQRCVDMLSGAAYTLGCQLHKISNRGIYLIASPYVRVMIDPAMKRFNATAEAQPFMQRQTGEYPPAQSFAGPQSEPQQDTAPAPQQDAYSSFQRPRPTFQSSPQGQQEPFRRAAGGGQYQPRQQQPFQTSYN